MLRGLMKATQSLLRRKRKRVEGDLARICCCCLVLGCIWLFCDSMDCSPLGSSGSWDSPGRNTGVGCHFIHQGNLPNPGIEPASHALQTDSLPWSYQGGPAARIVIGKRRLRSSMVERKKESEFENKLEIIQSRYSWLLAFLSFMIHSVGVCLVAQSPTLWTPWTVAQQAPLSMAILQARKLEWVAMPFSRRSSQPRDWTRVSCIAGRFFTIWATREIHIFKMKVKICTICCIHTTLLMWYLLKHLYKDWVICSLSPGEWIWNKNLKVFLKWFIDSLNIYLLRTYFGPDVVLDNGDITGNK